MDDYYDYLMEDVAMCGLGTANHKLQPHYKFEYYGHACVEIRKRGLLVK